MPPKKTVRELSRLAERRAQEIVRLEAVIKERNEEIKKLRSRPVVLKEWKRFHSGKWVREMPQKVGYYVVAARMGVSYPTSAPVYDISMTTLIYVFEDPWPGRQGQLTCTRTWGGLWWSEPLPDNFALYLPTTE
jgi:hypothetical protein